MNRNHTIETDEAEIKIFVANCSSIKDPINHYGISNITASEYDLGFILNSTPQVSMNTGLGMGSISKSYHQLPDLNELSGSIVNSISCDDLKVFTKPKNEAENENENVNVNVTNENPNPSLISTNLIPSKPRGLGIESMFSSMAPYVFYTDNFGSYYTITINHKIESDDKGISITQYQFIILDIVALSKGFLGEEFEIWLDNILFDSKASSDIFIITDVTPFVFEVNNPFIQDFLEILDTYCRLNITYISTDNDCFQNINLHLNASDGSNATAPERLSLVLVSKMGALTNKPVLFTDTMGFSLNGHDVIYITKEKLVNSGYLRITIKAGEDPETPSSSNENSPVISLEDSNALMMKPPIVSYSDMSFVRFDADSINYCACLKLIRLLNIVEDNANESIKTSRFTLATVRVYASFIENNDSLSSYLNHKSSHDMRRECLRREFIKDVIDRANGIIQQRFLF